MANKDYWASFGASAVSGLNPTFIVFVSPGGGNGTPPSITEPGSKGLYKFSYDASLTQIAFILDGFTSGLAFQDRYVKGVLDIYDQMGFSLNAMGSSLSTMGSSLSVMGSSLSVMGISLSAMGVSFSAFGESQLALGNSLVALGTSNLALGVSNLAIGTSLVAGLGDTASSYGTDVSDPTTVFGFLKRAQETREGNETYTKSTGVLDIYSRGSSQLLREKTISDSTTSTTKT